MAQAYKVIASADEFVLAREQFALLVSHLQSEEAAQLEHGQVEAYLSREGTELLRRLLQGHLDLRTRREVRRRSMRGSDAVLRTHGREGCERGLMTLFGEVRVRRMGYGARGHGSLYPLDAQLNLPRDRYSHGLHRRVSEEVSRSSFDEALERVESTTGGKVPKRQGEELAKHSSADFEAFYDTRRAEGAEPTEDPLVLSMDGKGIVMRAEGLREGTRRAAERARPKVKTRLSKGEKRNRKRMAMVATVYSVAPHVRTPAQIMGLEDGPQHPPPRPRRKRVWASVQREPEAVVAEVFAEARVRDPAQQREWAVLVDGQEAQLRYIRSAAQRQQVAVTLILDFIHVLEYLWKAAYGFHAEGTEEAERWVQQRALGILEGKASLVAAGMRRSATRRGLSPHQRANVDKCADYLLKYRDMLRYDEYLQRGLPIATGVIEGACRHLVKDRLDITGARWGLAGAEAILQLRSLRSSGDFERYWEFHLAKCRERTHLSRYADLSEAA